MDECPERNDFVGTQKKMRVEILEQNSIRIAEIRR